MGKTFARDFGLWALYFPARWAVTALPVPMAQATGRTTGRLHAMAARNGVEARLHARMREVLGEEEANRAARAYLIRKHQTLLEHFLIASRGEPAVDRLLGEIRGREHLDGARDRGAVLALFHYGNIRMLAALGFRGYPLVQLLNRTSAHAGRGHSHRLARMVRDRKIEMDGAMPAEFLHWEPGLLQARKVYRAPRKGKFLLVHLDGSRGSSFASFDFLGGRAPFAIGAARIAHRTGVDLLPVFCVARSDGRHDVVVEPPVDPAQGPKEMTARCVALLEDYVRRHPEQWWTWARLEMDVDDEGRVQMEPKAAALTDEEVLAGVSS